MEHQTKQTAKTFWDLNDGKITNLRMQKLAYLGHVVSLGELEKPLIPEGFQAWDYGPVNPELYHQMKPFGSYNIANVFGNSSLKHTAPKLFDIVSGVSKMTKNLTNSQLIALTHANDGAWSKSYRPGVKGVPIPNDLAQEDYELIFVDEES